MFSMGSTNLCVQFGTSSFSGIVALLLLSMSILVLLSILVALSIFFNAITDADINIVADFNTCADVNIRALLISYSNVHFLRDELLNT